MESGTFHCPEFLHYAVKEGDEMDFPVDHDLHCHTYLSKCSGDPEQTAENILKHARENGYTLQCITDHLWDRKVPGPNDFYESQDIDHVRQILPLPGDDQVRMVFGCETEFCGGNRLALDPGNYDQFDFIVIPPNHFHMTRPREYDTEEKTAGLFAERLEEISNLPLPWHKVGIAHITCSLIFKEGDPYLVYRLVDEKRFRAVMRKFAKLGAGIEINLSSFGPGWLEHKEDALRLYRMALEEGCKFYLASDAHHPDGLRTVPDRAPKVIELLGLKKEDQFRLLSDS